MCLSPKNPCIGNLIFNITAWRWIFREVRSLGRSYLHEWTCWCSYLKKNWGHEFALLWCEFRVYLSFVTPPSILCRHKKKAIAGYGKIVQWLRPITAPTENPGSVPSTHPMAHKHLCLQSHFLAIAGTRHTGDLQVYYLQVKHSYTLNK